jgi:ribulose-5-phosphate 4-epimerase/fuculose-1-phosphate aldolase
MKHPPQNKLTSEMETFYLGLQQSFFHVHASFSVHLGSQKYWFQHDPLGRQIIHGDRIRDGQNQMSKHFEVHQMAYQDRLDIGVCAIATPTTLLGCLTGNLVPIPLLWEEGVRELGMSIPLLSYDMWNTDSYRDEIQRFLQKSDVICIPHVGALVVGGSFGQILYRLQVLERLAHMMLIVKQIGKGKILTPTQAQKLIPNGRRPSVPNHKSQDIYTSQPSDTTDDWERW